MWAGLLPLLLLPASASFPRGVSFGSASAQQPFPAAGFNYPTNDRPPPSTITAAAASTSDDSGPLQNGYPMGDAAAEAPIGSGSPFKDGLPNARLDLEPRFGNGQVQGSPTPPDEPPAAAPYVPEDYHANEDTRDYAKPPGIKNPMPATLPKPHITSIEGGKTCAEVAEQNGGWLTIKGDNLGKADASDISSVQIVLVDRKGSSEVGMVQCAKVKTGGKGDDVEEEEDKGVGLQSPAPSAASGPDSDESEAAVPAASGSESSVGAEAGADSPSPLPDTAFGGEGSVSERLSVHAGLGRRLLSKETASRSNKQRQRSKIKMRQQQQRRQQQRGDPEAADPNKVVNGVELGTGRILELSCYLSPERISDVQTDSFGYVQINTISMGSSEPPPMNVVVAGASSEGEAGVPAAASGSEGAAGGGDLGAAAKFCCPKCPPSDKEIAIEFDAAQEKAKKDREEAELAAKEAQAKSESEAANAEAKAKEEQEAAKEEQVASEAAAKQEEEKLEKAQAVQTELDSAISEAEREAQEAAPAPSAPGPAELNELQQKYDSLFRGSFGRLKPSELFAKAAD